MAPLMEGDERQMWEFIRVENRRQLPVASGGSPDTAIKRRKGLSARLAEYLCNLIVRERLPEKSLGDLGNH